MRKFIKISLVVVILAIASYFTFLYTASYSKGYRSGELIKISNKGVIFKTWEGELSQGISGAQIFSFSILDSDDKVIADMKSLEGQYVQVTYVERYRTFPWWGDTRYFITKVQQQNSPFKLNK